MRGRVGIAPTWCERYERLVSEHLDPALLRTAAGAIRAAGRDVPGLPQFWEMEMVRPLGEELDRRAGLALQDSHALGAALGIMPGARGIIEDARSLEGTLHFMHAGWRAFGRRVFALESKAHAMLSRTDLPDLAFHEVPWPLACFYLRLPSGVFQVRSGYVGDAAQPIEGALLVLSPNSEIEGHSALSVLLTGASSVDAGDDNVQSARFLFPQDHPILTILDEMGAPSLGPAPFQAVLRTVFAMALYLASSSATVRVLRPTLRDGRNTRNPKKLRTHKARLTKVSRLPVTVVGPSYQNDGERRQLEQSVWVRGHFRRVAFGKAREQRRIQWIAPYVKGVELEADSRASVGIVYPPTEPRGS